jgi:hypothetical protein
MEEERRREMEVSASGWLDWLGDCLLRAVLENYRSIQYILAIFWLLFWLLFCYILFCYFLLLFCYFFATFFATFFENYRSIQYILATFSTDKVTYALILNKWVGLLFGPFISQTHLVALQCIHHYLLFIISILS